MKTLLIVVMLFLLSMIMTTNSNFHENAVSKSHTLLKAIKDFVPTILKFLDPHSCYLVLEIYHIGVKKMSVSLNPMQ